MEHVEFRTSCNLTTARGCPEFRSISRSIASVCCCVKVFLKWMGVNRNVPLFECFICCLIHLLILFLFFLNMDEQLDEQCQTFSLSQWLWRGINDLHHSIQRRNSVSSPGGIVLPVQIALIYYFVTSCHIFLMLQRWRKLLTHVLLIWLLHVFY